MLTNQASIRQKDHRKMQDYLDRRNQNRQDQTQ